MKQLKFSEPLPGLILEGQKNSTWRINDEKGIAAGDKISLCYNNGSEFAKAEVTHIKETVLENLTAADKEGHEEFSSDVEMYRIYSKYYKTNVTPKTKVKIIKFKLLNK